MSARSADERPLELFRILRVLREHEVDLVVIGGFSVVLHGYERFAKDVDVVPEQSAENLTRLQRAVEALGAKPRDIASGGREWVLNTELGRLTVWQQVSGIDRYEELRGGAMTIAVPGAGDVLFAGLDDLLAMKRAAGRDQDLLDITALRMAHGLEE